MKNISLKGNFNFDKKKERSDYELFSAPLFKCLKNNVKKFAFCSNLFKF